MITHLYKCDKCGYEQSSASKNSPSTRNMYETYVQLKSCTPSSAYTGFQTSISPQPLICEECLNKLQITLKPKYDERVLTSAEKLFAIFEDYIQEQVTEAIQNG